MFINRIKKAGGGVQKEYILKDGTFKIQPTVNTCRKVENNYEFYIDSVDGGSRITIPYSLQNKNIFIEFVSQATTNTGFYYISNGAKEIVIIFKTQEKFIISLPSSNIIDIKSTNLPRNCQLKSIWTEDINV